MELLVLYGSQTGTAEDVAENIWRASKRFSFKGPLLALDDYSFPKLINAGLAVFVISTTGQGEEPDNMKKFWKNLLRKSLPSNSLERLKFACLGLGDSGYVNYNFAAKKLNRRLIQLGASPIVPIGLCDDQHAFGIGAVFLPWIENFWSSVQKLYPDICTAPLSVECFKWKIELCKNLTTTKTRFKQPLNDDLFQLRLKENNRTTTEEHFQDVRLLKFFLPEKCLWNPGDVINVFPCNSDQRVEEFFEIILKVNSKYNRNTTVRIESIHKDMPIPAVYQQIISLDIAAKYVWDLNALPRQRVFELLSTYCDDENEKAKLIELSSFEGLEDLLKYINKPKRTILELLHDFPNATAGLTLPIIFELFSLIKPRSYSIASVPETGSLDILVAIVEYKTILPTIRLGLCSNWLKSLKINEEIFAILKPAKLKIPRETRIPLIMVSTGTGVAPLRSIILRREALLKENGCSSDILIFLGFRSEVSDFHCRDDFLRFERLKLIQCFTAFSRDQEHKIYVQNLIIQNGADVKNMLLKENCTVLVVGSSKNMPKAVKKAFIELVGEKCEIIFDMIKDGRYQEETWN